MTVAAISVFVLLKMLSAEQCVSVVVNDPVKKETIAYTCFPPVKEPA